MTHQALPIILLLISCRPCDLHVRGACVDYDAGDGLSPPPHARAQWEAAIDRSLEYWGLEADALEGWTLVVHRAPVRCFLLWRGKDGCANLILGEIHLQKQPGCATALLPHELGHLAHQWDIGHSRALWEEVDQDARRLGACEYEKGWGEER
jgi:hypothetical protein